VPEVGSLGARANPAAVEFTNEEGLSVDGRMWGDLPLFLELAFEDRSTKPRNPSVSRNLNRSPYGAVCLPMSAEGRMLQLFCRCHNLVFSHSSLTRMR
jgi:hypothetical protein